MNVNDCCNTCLWKKRFLSLHKKYKKINLGYLNNDNYEGLESLFSINSINNRKNINYPLKNIKKDYYVYYNKLYPVSNKNNDHVNSVYKIVNKYNDEKKYININIIFEWYYLYSCYIEELNISKRLSFEEYVNYNKNKFKYIEKICRFKNKVYRCYLFILELKRYIPNYLKDNGLIDVLKKCNISYTKLYRLKIGDINELVKFILEKYNMYNDSNNIVISKPIQNFHKNINTNTNINPKLTTILKYPGNKTKLLNKYGNTLNINGKKYFVDAFCGSLSVSIYVKKINPDINILAIDSNHYLINFYTELRDNNKILIEKIKEYIDLINNMEFNIKMEFIKKLIHVINNISVDNVLKASIFYILNKLSLNYIKYTNKGLLRMDIDKRLLNKSINFNPEKLEMFSSFLENILLINFNYNRGYTIINDYISQLNSSDIFIYFDPPYDDKDFSGYITPFDKRYQEKLFEYVKKLTLTGILCLVSNRNTLFIRELYDNYNIAEIDIYSPLSKDKIREELLIYNYK